MTSDPRATPAHAHDGAPSELELLTRRLSVGVASGTGEAATSLLRRADEALHAAKSADRDAVHAPA